MPLIETIKKVLFEQVQGCRLLLELLQREKICLVNLQMDGIEALTKEKDILVLKLRLLEEERMRLIDRFVLENFPDLPDEGTFFSENQSSETGLSLPGKQFFKKFVPN